MTRGYAQQLAEAAAAAEKRVRHRKFEWCRLRNEFWDFPVWRQVAEMLHLPLHQVQAFGGRLDSFANAAIPRGYVGDFNAAQFGVTLGMSAEDAARIYAALEHADVGWIDQDHVVNFWARNPDDKQDTTAAARQQRKRDRAKAMKAIAAEFRRGEITELERVAQERWVMSEQFSTVTDRHAVTHRDSVTVTPRADQRFEARPVDNFSDGVRGESAGSPKGDVAGAGGSPQVEAWLRSEGLRIVIERMTMPRGLAETRLERWVRELQGNEAALAAIIEAADAANLGGSRFHVSVSEQIKRRLHDAEGPRLPLMRKLGGAA